MASELQDWLNVIGARIKGRIAMRPGEVELFAAVMAECPGDHVEIGTLWGGSAVLALLAKPAGHIYAIDPLIGYYGQPDHLHNNETPTAEDVLENFQKFGAGGRITLVKAKSHPWPLWDGIEPESVLIDGDHETQAVIDDWLSARRRAGRFVLFHDYNHAAFPGITYVVDNFARKDPAWKPYGCEKTLIVFEKVGDGSTV